MQVSAHYVDLRAHVRVCWLDAFRCHLAAAFASGM